MNTKSSRRFSSVLGIMATLVVLTGAGVLVYTTWPQSMGAMDTVAEVGPEKPVATAKATPKLVWCEQAPDHDCIKPAADSGKRVLVLFTAKWCGWCRLFHEKILPDPEVQKLLGNFYLIEVDSERAKDFVEKSGIEGYPTWFIFEKGMTKIIDEHVGGFRAPGAFIKRFKKDIAP